MIFSTSNSNLTISHLFLIWSRSVVVITSALHAEGLRFDPGRDHGGFFLKLIFKNFTMKKKKKNHELFHVSSYTNVIICTHTIYIILTFHSPKTQIRKTSSEKLKIQVSTNIKMYQPFEIIVFFML